MAKRGYPFAPQIFLRPDGSLTDNPNEILSLLKDHAEKNYSHHRNTREDALFAQFVNLFQDEINNLKNSIKLPLLMWLTPGIFSRKNPPTKPRVWRKRLDDEDKILFCKWGLFNRLRGVGIGRIHCNLPFHFKIR
jgi:hypothetical protein